MKRITMQTTNVLLSAVYYTCSLNRQESNFPQAYARLVFLDDARSHKTRAIFSLPTHFCDSYDSCCCSQQHHVFWVVTL
jgi:hypothetical protein